jgi:olfactory receptor
MVREFILLVFGLGLRIRIVTLGIFSLLFIFILLRIGVILGLILPDCRLHIPLYFFPFHLAIVDITFACSVVPQMLVNLLDPAKHISFAGCMMQTCLFWYVPIWNVSS